MMDGDGDLRAVICWKTFIATSKIPVGASIDAVDRFSDIYAK